jgi:hypothetical protein
MRYLFEIHSREYFEKNHFVPESNMFLDILESRASARTQESGVIFSECGRRFIIKEEDLQHLVYGTESFYCEPDIVGMTFPSILKEWMLKEIANSEEQPEYFV